MGFKVEFNSIIRIDVPTNSVIGDEYYFENAGSRVYFDDIPIWLLQKDWTAVAEVQVVSQTRTINSIKGRYRVLYLYTETESKLLTEMFRRMYGWK
jgi:hypothetical protein